MARIKFPFRAYFTKNMYKKKNLMYVTLRLATNTILISIK